MTMTFNNLGAFATHLGGLVVGMEHAETVALRKAAKIVQTEAKRVIGTYEYGWTPLKPDTIKAKARGDTPLLETGQLRDSIGIKVGIGNATIGSNEMKAVWQELGTSRIPPRSFLVAAAKHKQKEVVAEIGKVIISRWRHL
ncbi:hypothetical protein GCM10007036_14480 [Alsobacter metallidurans]|uniref:Uncharacterized protein n=1 Tax=Alsobacter metallidurans TaxID=340221 RepID=A0A917I4X9_9HYPH|nr:HK97 gp10 family phage protein [Alsobacter metallidurans]GGH14882.1 hypothetical protein GCM10007036_14480 [Alsobacter metallidurans]